MKFIVNATLVLTGPYSVEVSKEGLCEVTPMGAKNIRTMAITPVFGDDPGACKLLNVDPELGRWVAKVATFQLMESVYNSMKKDIMEEGERLAPQSMDKTDATA